MCLYRQHYFCGHHFLRENFTRCGKISGLFIYLPLICDSTLACEVLRDTIHQFASDLSMIDSRCPIAFSYISLLDLTKGKQPDELRSQIFTNSLKT